MLFSEITTEHYLKLSKNSITVKDFNDKTRGIIRAQRFTDAPPRVQFEHSKAIGASGIWKSHHADKAYISSGNIYFIDYAFNEKYKSDNYLNMIDAAAAAGIIVIKCRALL